MKSVLISTLMAALLGFQCKTYYSNKANTAVYKSIYIDQFKLSYFKALFSKSFNNSNEVKKMLEIDHSDFTEPMLSAADFFLIDSLTSVDSLKIQIDSAEGNRRAEGAQGKRPFGFILYKINSNWLDSLANKSYKSSNIKVMYSN